MEVSFQWDYHDSVRKQLPTDQKIYSNYISHPKLAKGKFLNFDEQTFGMLILMTLYTAKYKKKQIHVSLIVVIWTYIF